MLLCAQMQRVEALNPIFLCLNQAQIDALEGVFKRTLVQRPFTFISLPSGHICGHPEFVVMPTCSSDQGGESMWCLALV